MAPTLKIKLSTKQEYNVQSLFMKYNFLKLVGEFVSSSNTVDFYSRWTLFESQLGYQLAWHIFLNVCRQILV
jgi:hypothetical protein